MKGYCKKRISLIAAGFLGVLILISPGCIGSKSAEFQNKIQKMSDNDLLNYYEVINERIKEVDDSSQRSGSLERHSQEPLFPDLTFFFGGEGYTLYQERRAVLKELKVRNIPYKKDYRK